MVDEDNPNLYSEGPGYKDSQDPQVHHFSLRDSPTIIFETCHNSFSSKNKLYQHVRQAGHAVRRKRKTRVETTINPEVYTSTSGTAETLENIVDSDSDSPKDIGIGQAFQKYRYARVNIKLTAIGKVIVVCVDSGSGNSLIDEAIINQFLPDTPIRTIASPIEVSGIGSDRHQTDRYVLPRCTFLAETIMVMTPWLRQRPESFISLRVCARVC